METILGELLDKTYELEGLIHLCKKKDDSPIELLRLISKKGKEVNDLCEKLKNSHPKGLQVEEDFTHNISSREFSLDEYYIDETADATLSSGNMTELKDNEESPKENQRKGKLVFSINERYRFKKELFDNSDIDFNNTLALVASMEDYEEAEDYFINEEGFDRYQPAVGEFLEIIKRYFK